MSSVFTLLPSLNSNTHEPSTYMNDRFTMLSHTPCASESGHLTYLKNWELPKWLIIDDEWTVHYDNTVLMEEDTYRTNTPSYQHYPATDNFPLPNAAVKSPLRPLKPYLIQPITPSSLKHLFFSVGLPDPLLSVGYYWSLSISVSFILFWT